MLKLGKTFRSERARHKIQLVAAIFLTVVLLIAIPVAAWFANRREIVKLQRVSSPNALYLSAAHREDSSCFEINGVDAEEIVVDGYGTKILDGQGKEQKITHKDYVFSVTGDAVDKFTIQLAYTTNNPFTYEVYAAKELTTNPREPGVPVDYVEYELTGKGVTGMPVITGITPTPPAHLFYKVDTTVTEGGASGKYNGRYLNSSTGTEADQSYHADTYDGYGRVDGDAEPVYWQATNVSAKPGEVNANKEAFSRHFILRVKWEAGELDNTAKETDIIYITVKATS